jgi:hypothetical protein
MVLAVLSFRKMDSDADHYLVVAKVRDRLAVSKHKMLKFHTERFNHNKLTEVEGIEQYQVQISNMFRVLKMLYDNQDINRAGKTIRENIKISTKQILDYYEPKKYKPWFDKEYSELLDEEKQARFQWLQSPSQINGGNQSNVKCEARAHFRSKMRE